MYFKSRDFGFAFLAFCASGDFAFRTSGDFAFCAGGDFAFCAGGDFAFCAGGRTLRHETLSESVSCRGHFTATALAPRHWGNRFARAPRLAIGRDT